MKEKLDRLELLKQATIVNDSELIDFNQEKDIYDALLNKLFDGELDYLYPAQTIKDLGDADKRKLFELARKYKNLLFYSGIFGFWADSVSGVLPDDYELICICLFDNYDFLLDCCDVLIINGEVVSSDNRIITNIGDKKYYLSSDSFFQVNEFLIDKMFNRVLEYVKELKPVNVLDLYCGTGSFGVYIADYAESIVGVDYNSSNIKDAIDNMRLNNISNIEYICDKVENVIDRFNNYDLVIVDPPRAGLDKKSCQYLIDMNPKNIIYISCDPNTLMRDLKILGNIYSIKEITPYNLFPKTYHVECVSLLSRKTIEK